MQEMRDVSGSHGSYWVYVANYGVLHACHILDSYHIITLTVTRIGPMPPDTDPHLQHGCCVYPAPF